MKKYGKVAGGPAAVEKFLAEQKCRNEGDDILLKELELAIEEHLQKREICEQQLQDLNKPKQRRHVHNASSLVPNAISPGLFNPEKVSSSRHSLLDREHSSSQQAVRRKVASQTRLPRRASDSARLEDFRSHQELKLPTLKESAFDTTRVSALPKNPEN